MSANKPQPSPLDTSTAATCLYCTCCKGIFSAPTGRACYSCAITHGIQLRGSRQIFNESAKHDADLLAAMRVMESIQSIPLAMDAIRRGETMPFQQDAKTWSVSHKFTSPTMKKAAAQWNQFVQSLLTDAPTPDLEGMLALVGVGVSEVTATMEAVILEYKAMAILEDVGALPAFLRCPTTNYALAGEAC